MASVILDLSGTLPESFSVGTWPLSTFNSGVWRFTWTPDAASTSAPWAGTGTTYWAMFTSADNGGLWTTWEGGTNNIALFNQASGANIFSRAITWAAGANIVILIDHPSGEVTISGALTGNGTFGFTTADAFSNTILQAGKYGASSTYNLPDSALSDVDDANDAISGTASVTLGALTAVAAGDADLEGTAAVTLGALTASSAGDADLNGAAAVTLGALTATATGSVGGDVTGDANITLGAVTASATGDADLNGSASITLGELTASATGDADLAGSASVTLGALTVSATGSVDAGIEGASSVTLGALTSTAVGDADLTGAAAIILGELTVAASEASPFALGAYGAERIIFGTTVTEVNLTLQTQTSGSTFVVCTGGRLTDIANAPTDNKGNTYTALGSAAAYTDWPNYGLRMWKCIDGAGGADHIFTQVMTVNDEVSIGVVEVKDGLVIQDSAIVEVYGPDPASVDTPVVTSTGPAHMIAFWGGDQNTGQTAVITPTTLTVIDDSTFPDDPNGYILLGILHEYVATPTTDYTDSIGQVPSQNAVVGTVVVQAAAGAPGAASITLGELTVAASGEAALDGAASITLGELTTAATGDADLEGTAAVTLGELTAAASGTVAGAIEGTAAITLGAVTTTASGDADLAGAAAVTLGALTVAATGLLDADIFGGSAITLGALTTSATGDADVDGTAAVTLGALTASASGDVDIDGTAAATLGALTASSAGTVGAATAALSTYLADSLINAVLRNVAYTSPAAVYMSLWTTNPTAAGTGTEVAAVNGYARQAISFDAPSAGASQNSGLVAFAASGGAWGTVTHFGIHDALTGGNLLLHSPLSSPAVMGDGNTLDFAAGTVTVTLSAELSTYLQHALLDAVLRSTTYTPPATVYQALYTDDPTDDDVGTEVTGGGYARQAVAFDAPTAGVSQNTSIETWTATGSAYGTVTHVGLRDAITAGNLLGYSPMGEAQVIGNGKRINFAAGAVTFTLG